MAELKQAALAERVALLLSDPFTPQTLSKIMSGRQRPGGDQLVAIAHEMGETDYTALAGLRKPDEHLGKKKPKRPFEARPVVTRRRKGHD